MPRQHTDKSIALFDIDEIELGEKLGSGGFNDVYEIVSFNPNNTNRNVQLKMLHREPRNFLSESARDESTGENRYAIKFISESLLDDFESFEIGAEDLHEEANLLSSLDHPNIIKIRGWATNGLQSYSRMKCYNGYFIILDRLSETLADTISSWKRQMKQLRKSKAKEEVKQKKKKLVQLEQLKIAFDIACAIKYLHDKRIIYRDLKPENVGLNSRGETKLFDMGLARDLPDENEGDMDATFEMSGRAGTARYMAPEVYSKTPYNEKADVYSFAHLLWEILALEKPYDGFSAEEHKKYVIKRGERPPIDPRWPRAIRKLLENAWQKDMTQRPSMAEVRDVLMQEIVSCSKSEKKTKARRSSGVSGERRGSYSAKLGELGIKTPVGDSALLSSSGHDIKLQEEKDLREQTQMPQTPQQLERKAVISRAA